MGRNGGEFFVEAPRRTDSEGIASLSGGGICRGGATSDIQLPAERPCGDGVSSGCDAIPFRVRLPHREWNHILLYSCMLFQEPMHTILK